MASGPRRFGDLALPPLYSLTSWPQFMDYSFPKKQFSLSCLGLTFRCRHSEPSAAWGRLQLRGRWAQPSWGAGTLPLFLQPSPGAPARLPSPPVLSLPFTSSSLSPHPLWPLDVTPVTSLFCASVSSPKMWDEEKQPPAVAGGGRSEAGDRNHKSASEQRR